MAARQIEPRKMSKFFDLSKIKAKQKYEVFSLFTFNGINYLNSPFLSRSPRLKDWEDGE